MIAGLRSLIVLALCGVSLVLLGQQLAGDSVRDFAHSNILDFYLRRQLLGVEIAVAIGILGVGFLYTRLYGHIALGRLRTLSRIACPLLLACFVPALANQNTWEPLPTVIGIACFALVLERLLRISIDAILGATDSAGLGVSTRRARRIGLFVTVAAAAFYGFYMSRYTVFSHRRFGTYNYDLGQYDNIFWNALHGHPMRCTPLGAVEDWSELGGHADLTVFLLLPFYAIRPNAETLLIMQSFILGLGAIPIYLFAVRRVSASVACPLALAYLLFPPLHGANFYDFHFQPLAAVFVLLTIYFVDTRRWIPAAVFFAFAIGSREDTSVGLTMLGLYFLLTGYRAKAGFVMAVVGVVYFVVIRFYVMSRYGQGWFADIYKDLYPAPNGPHTYAGIMHTLATNPVYVFRTLLTEDKLRYFLQIVTPIAFLPLRRGYLLPSLAPGFLFTLMTTGYAPTIDIAFQYSGHFTPYIFTASAIALAAYAGRRQTAHLYAACATLCVATVLCTLHWGAFPPHGTIRGGFLSVGFSHPTAADEQRHRDLVALAAMVPPAAALGASEEELPHVSNRLNVFSLRSGAGGVEYIVYGLNGGGAGVAAQALGDGSFVEIARLQAAALLRRK